MMRAEWENLSTRLCAVAPTYENCFVITVICHYEFHINRQPKNPTTVELPRAASVPKEELASFQAKTSTLLAQLKLFEEAEIIGSQDTKRALA